MRFWGLNHPGFCTFMHKAGLSGWSQHCRSLPSAISCFNWMTVDCFAFFMPSVIRSLYLLMQSFTTSAAALELVLNEVAINFGMPASALKQRRSEERRVGNAYRSGSPHG